MKETALLDTPLANAASARERVQVDASAFIQHTQEFVNAALDLPAKIRSKWDGLRHAIEQGQVEAARAVHGAFLHSLQQCFGIVQDAQLLAERAAVLGGKPLPRAEQLTAVLLDLERLRREALAGWQYPLPGQLGSMSVAPVYMDEHADIYAGRSRVRLDTIINEFKAGASPEDIARGYDTLQLAEIQEVIAYYLRYRDVVDEYLTRRKREAEELRQKIEASQPSNAELKAQIKDRWARRKATNASPAE